MRIEHRHLTVKQRKRQVMTIGALAIAGQRTDAIGMRQRTRLGMDAALHTRVGEQATQRAVLTRNTHILHELSIDRFVVVSIGQHRHQRTRRQMVVHAQPATVVDHQRRIAQTKVMAQELPQILHTRGRHVRVAGIHRMTQRIEQRRGLRIARVLPHQTRRAVHTP